MIQAIHKDIESEMEFHQLTHGYWRCDYTTVKHPERLVTIHHGNEEFPTMELATESALREARDAIDQWGLRNRCFPASQRDLIQKFNKLELEKKEIKL
jgi:hypothetical protein